MSNNRPFRNLDSEVSDTEFDYQHNLDERRPVPEGGIMEEIFPPSDPNNIENKDLNNYEYMDVVDSSSPVYYSDHLNKDKILSFKTQKAVVFPGEQFPLRIKLTQDVKKISEVLEKSKFVVLISTFHYCSVATLCSVSANDYYIRGKHINIILFGKKFVNVIKSSQDDLIFLGTQMSYVQYTDQEIDASAAHKYISEPVSRKIHYLKSEKLHNTSSLSTFTCNLISPITFINKMKKYISRIGIPIECLPDDLYEIHIILLRLLPLNYEQYVWILGQKCMLKRIQSLLIFTDYSRVILCRTCGAFLCRFDDIDRNSLSMNLHHVNGNGIPFSMILTRYISGESFRGGRYKETTFYENYAWIILECLRCNRHLGWKYVADEHLDLEPFYGLDREKISFISPQAMNQFFLANVIRPPGFDPNAVLMTINNMENSAAPPEANFNVEESSDIANLQTYDEYGIGSENYQDEEDEDDGDEYYEVDGEDDGEEEGEEDDNVTE